MNRNCGFRDATGEFYVTNKRAVVSLRDSKEHPYNVGKEILMRIQSFSVTIPEELFTYD